MRKRTVIYRGNLKSCNYTCSYCPFAKHRALTAELEKDRRNFERFCDSVEKRVQDFSIGAVLVTPYGEASIHRWYWEGLSRLAGLPGIDRVGMQTNLSFSVAECMKGFSQPAKLCLWATFHPEMTTVDAFAAKCHRLAQNHVQVCAGAVGVPENIQLIRELREKLSPAVYLWVNRMDGLKRNYRPDEISAFTEIDPFFACELDYPEADPSMCADRCFVEADGKVRSCNISKTKGVDWYESGEEEIFAPVCSGKRCTCYLSYGGRSDFAWKNIFGDHSVFRIPRKFKAVFFDLDGTLISVKRETGDIRGGLSELVRRRLIALGEICPIFLATSMPETDVKRRLKGDMELFQGGIYASGGYLHLKDQNGDREKIYPINIDCLSEVIEEAMGPEKSVKARCMVSEKNGTVYKVTLIKSHHGHWTDEECYRMAELLTGFDCRFFTEDHCLEIVRKDCDKGTGIEEICSWLGISPEDTLAVGNDREDEAMERVCGGYIRMEAILCYHAR
ncbi:MAG: STM4011 family radical SAM protein [Eubacterium sp.]|nr:STM4011 family radical SAM protein [Eubacterium sp.]MCM1213072.1 STM4011 family radical SAM protein [Lachnospiraceae bacterium]MCM1240755.1 STM4011 family radical SAM protein [Lachnospiraceae bacterium]MCM1240830.1 STM4011 family radical SAM protein [Lachnospiraceae bacterium]